MVIAGRLIVGGGALLAPRVTGRLFGISSEANPALPYVGRLFGGRAVLMAALLAAARPAERERQARAGIVVDVVDAVAAVAAWRGGQLSSLTATAAFAAAATEAALGAVSVGALSSGRSRWPR
jgi:hypothetical protein